MRANETSEAQGTGQGAGAGYDPEDLEWVGVTEPWTPAHLARMEQVLDLQSVDLEDAELEPVGGRDA